MVIPVNYRVSVALFDLLIIKHNYAELREAVRTRSHLGVAQVPAMGRQRGPKPVRSQDISIIPSLLHLLKTAV